jgi:Zn-dependent metalloprotease
MKKMYVSGFWISLPLVALFLLPRNIYAGERFQPEIQRNQNLINNATWNRINIAVENLEIRSGKGMVIVPAMATGIPSYLYVKGGTLPMSYAPTGSEKPADAANLFFQEYKDIFGISEPGEEMKINRVSAADALGMAHVRYQQYYQGIPVVAGEMVVHLNSKKAVTMANGEYLPDINVDPNPKIDSTAILERFKEAALTNHNLIGYKITTPELRIFNLGLLKDALEKTHLVYQAVVEGTDKNGKPIKERYFMDAHSGETVFHFSEIHYALSRKIYNALAGTLPGTLVRSEGDAATGDTDADNAYTYSGDTYNYFLNTHGRDSLDGAGMPLISSVHSPKNCPNAYWDGSQMVFCDNLVTPDIMAHELTHGVTSYSADLVYSFQSGALNESYSDIFGSASDGNWTLGEGSAIGIIRDMSNPPAYYQPDKVSSFMYNCSAGNSDGDYGGVHINSGVTNKAAYLMAAGGSFNNYTISGIGRKKMELIEYRALTTKLTSGSDFTDNYNAINTSCQELINTNGITSADCAEVTKAMDAVEMKNSPTCIVPDIKANGSNGPISINKGDTITLAISLSPRGLYEFGDYFILAKTPFSWYYYTGLTWAPGQKVLWQWPIISLSSFRLLPSNFTLPIGAYTFYFLIDKNMNGTIDMDSAYYDSVKVTVK